MVLLIYFSAFDCRSTVSVNEFSSVEEAKAAMHWQFEDNILEEKFKRIDPSGDVKDQLLKIGVDLYKYDDNEIAYSDEDGNVSHWKVSVI